MGSIYFTKNIYFLGLLAVQIIEKNECPVFKLESTKSSKRNNFYQNNDITPHLKSVIARMVQQKPSYRYGELSALKRDLIQVSEFIKKRNSVSGDGRKLLGRLTLIDYLDFRIEIAERAPDVPTDPLQRANWILEEISKQIHYYSDKETVSVLFSNSSRLPFINPVFWYWLSPESRILIGLAFDWESLINGLNEQLGFTYPNKISNILLGRVVYFESLATIQGILAYGSLDKEATKLFSDSLSSTIQHEHYSELRIKAPLDKFSQPLPNPYLKEDLNPVINLFRFIDGNNWIIVLRRVSAKSIFSGISFSRNKIDFFYSDYSKAFATEPLYKTNKLSSKTWLVHKLPYKFINSISPKSDESIELLWKDTVNVIKYLRTMNPCKRKRGRLVDYIPVAVPRQGSVYFGWNWASFSSVEANFTEDRVLTLGTMIIANRGKHKAIQIDLLDKTKTISAIFSAPSIFSNIKSGSGMSFESAIAYSMKKHKGFAWVLAVLLAVLQYVFASSFWETLPLAIQLVSGCIIILLVRLVVNPLWKIVEERLAIIRPEDKVLEAN